MKRHLEWLFLAAVGMPLPLLPCDCRAPRPACAHLEADGIFLGRLTFTNDDGSGGFAQQTLVRFDIEERFKGIAPSDREVWVDPGSYTSCYNNYRMGTRYLVFAGLRSGLPNGTAAMTILRDGSGKS